MDSASNEPIIERAKRATPHDDLIASLLDPRIPKTECEHAAAKEIESIRAKLSEAEKRLALLNSLAKQNISYDRYGNGGYWSIGLFSKDSYMSFTQAIDAAIANESKTRSE